MRQRTEIFTKAKSNCRAYRKPRPSRRKSVAVPVLKECLYRCHIAFYTEGRTLYTRFTRASVYMYDEGQEVSFYCVDLLWKQKLYQELRFVFVK